MESSDGALLKVEREMDKIHIQNEQQGVSLALELLHLRNRGQGTFSSNVYIKRNRYID